MKIKETIIKTKGFIILLEITERFGPFKDGNFTVLNKNITGLNYYIVRDSIAKIHGTRKILSIEIFDHWGNNAYNDNYMDSSGSFCLKLY